MSNELEEVTFRDGKRWVPKYIANLLEGIETFKLPYDEAMKAANAKMTNDYVVGQMNSVIAGHLRGR